MQKVTCFPLFKAEGYTDGDLTLYHSFTLTEFLKAENPVDFLGKASTVRYLMIFNPCIQKSLSFNLTD